MPKAAELVALCQRQQREEGAARAVNDDRTDAQRAAAFADQRNAGLRPRPNGDEIEWHVGPNGDPKLRFKPDAHQEMWKRDRIAPADVNRVNFGLKKWGSAMRWTADGFPFELAPGEHDPAPASLPIRRD